MNVFGVLAAVVATATPWPAPKIPTVVLSHLSTLREARSLRDFPKSVGTHWKMADRGAPWQATDVVITPHLPWRRFIAGGCDHNLCLLHYEKGGIGHSESIAAFEYTGTSYRLIWNVTGSATYSNLKNLDAAIRSRLGSGDWWDHSPDDVPAHAR